MDLKNKNIVYVGGLGGIGVEVCKLLMLKDIKSLFLLDKCENRDALNVIKAINSNVPVYFLNYDVTMSVEDMRKKFAEIIAKIRKIDILINGFGIMDESAIVLTIKTNLNGLINTIVAAFDHMDKRCGGPGGVILNIACKSGLNGLSPIPVYGATTAAIVSFTTSLSQLVPLTGVAALVFCPGLTRTPLIRKINTFLKVDEDFSSRLEKMDIMVPENVAKKCVSILETCRNGAIWLLHLNEMTAVKVPTYWEVPEQLAK